MQVQNAPAHGIVGLFVLGECVGENENLLVVQDLVKCFPVRKGLLQRVQALQLAALQSENVTTIEGDPAAGGGDQAGVAILERR